MNSTSADRNEYIDTYRGVACVLLVAYHTIGGSVTGLRLPDDSFWRTFGDGLIYFRMPMFAFLSGVVYGQRPFTQDAPHFITGKARKLLLPMLIVGTVFAALRSTMPGVNIPWQNWSTLHIIPDAQYWFSESLFLIFLFVMILELLNILGDLRKFAIVLAIAAIVHLTITPPRLLGMWGANYLFPFFLCGLGCTRFGIAKSRFLPIYIAVLLFTSSYAIAGVLGYVPRSDRISVIALILGMVSCFSLLVSGWKNKTFAAIGFYSFSIYLFHVFFTASTRIFAHAVNFENANALVFVATAAGVYGPILVEKFADRSALTRTLLLGKPWSRSAHRLAKETARSGRSYEPRDNPNDVDLQRPGSIVTIQRLAELPIGSEKQMAVGADIRHGRMRTWRSSRPAGRGAPASG